MSITQSTTEPGLIVVGSSLINIASVKIGVDRVYLEEDGHIRHYGIIDSVRLWRGENRATIIWERKKPWLPDSPSTTRLRKA